MARVTVHIPGLLRRFTGNRAEMELRGGTVREVVAALEAECPGLKGKLLGADGEVKQFIGVYLNENNIRDAGGAGAALKDGDELRLAPAAAGG